MHPAISFNGVGLSPDERVVYCAETDTQKVWAFDIEAPGKVAAAQGFQRGRILATLPGLQWLDSLAVEESGAVCVATLVNGGVSIVQLDGRVEHVALPDPWVTNLCFGGADMRDAYITLSGTGRLIRARWPRPGLRLNFAS